MAVYSKPFVGKLEFVGSSSVGVNYEGVGYSIGFADWPCLPGTKPTFQGLDLGTYHLFRIFISTHTAEIVSMDKLIVLPNKSSFPHEWLETIEQVMDARKSNEKNHTKQT